jgi:aldose 1-epimerase
MNIQSVRNDQFVLQILPDIGASILNLSAASGRPVLRRVHPEAVQTSSQCASFTLLPYSNRIRDARFTFEGRSIQLTPNASGLAQHGDVRNRPWQVERVSDAHLACTFDSRDFADVNWPWAFTARTEYLLHGPHLDISVTLTNQDAAPMPAGMGLHPYFARWDTDTDPALSFQAGGVYLTGDSSIPTEGARPIPPELDFSVARPVGEAKFDHVYSSWDGVARLAWAGKAGAERALTLTADSVWSHLVLFTAPDGSLALEPVTHATDAFNLAARGVHGTDMRVLLPGQNMVSGQSLGGAVRLTLEGDWS